MDQEADSPLNASDGAEEGGRGSSAAFSRRDLLRYGATGLACAGCGGLLVHYFSTRAAGRHGLRSLPRRRPAGPPLAAMAGTRLGQGGHATT